MSRDCDCTVVEHSTNLKDLKRCERKVKGNLPFYLSEAAGGGLLLDGRPEIIRQFLRTYYSQHLYLFINLVSFLNTEGIAAQRVTMSAEDVLGFHADITDN